MLRITSSLLIALALILASCGEETSTNTENPNGVELSDKESRVTQIRDLQRELMDQNTLETDSATAVQLLAVSVAYVNDFPDDDAAADYLMIGVSSASGLQQFQLSLTLLERLMARYPNYSSLEHVYYLHAYILDYNFKNRETQAEASYRALLGKFPNYEHAEEVKARLESIGMDELEMIRQFEKKNAVDSAS